MITIWVIDFVCKALLALIEKCIYVMIWKCKSEHWKNGIFLVTIHISANSTVSNIDIITNMAGVQLLAINLACVIDHLLDMWDGYAYFYSKRQNESKNNLKQDQSPECASHVTFSMACYKPLYYLYFINPKLRMAWAQLMNFNQTTQNCHNMLQM